jgi:large subunit ribosomal protein L13
MGTFSAKASEVERKWFVVDATDLPLGRLASNVASVIRGKHKPIFTPHADTGDFVIVINADKVKLTGNKPDTKFRHWHSQYPGGFGTESYRTLLVRKPELAIEEAVFGMLPKNRLGRTLRAKLKVYRGPTHPHSAQTPEALTVRL